MQQQEKELFEGYEIKSWWHFSPRLYKIVGASTVINLLAVLVIAQGGLLTRKSCDSPFVSSICQVLDTVYVGSVLIGADSEFVSKEYQKSELEDADITYIDVSSASPPLEYPAGYFALANPEQALMQDPMMNGFDNQPLSGFSAYPSTPPAMSGSSDLLGSKPNLPPVNPNPIIGELPTSTGGSNPIVSNPYLNRKFPRIKTPKQPKMINESPKDLPKLDGTETAQNTKPKADKTPDENQKPLESDAVKPIEVNKKPFEDLGDALNDKVAKKEIDFTKPFFVVLDATLNADGTFDPKKSRWNEAQTKGDPQMVEAAKKALESVGYSGILGYLKLNGIDRVNFTLVQDDKQIYAIIRSDQKTPEKAHSTASGFNMLLSGLILADNNGITKLDENSKIIVNNSKVTSDGKNFVLNFAIPKQMGQDLIDKSLKQRAEKKNSQTDNSNGVSQNTNAKTAK